MALGIYKQGQGYWTRMMTLLGSFTLFAWGAAWLAGQVSKIDLPKDAAGVYVVEPTIVRGGIAFTVIVVGAVISYWLAYAKPRTSEFLIATEGEMKKVNWSSRREIMGSTWVVIGISLILATLLFCVDILFKIFFEQIGVLESA